MKSHERMTKAELIAALRALEAQVRPTTLSEGAIIAETERPLPEHLRQSAPSLESATNALHLVMKEAQAIQVPLTNGATRGSVEQPAHDRTTMRENAARFRAIFKQSAVGVTQAVSRTGQYVNANQKMCDITGYSREELLARSFQDITHPDDVHADLDLMQQLLEGKIRAFTMEKRFCCKDGRIIWANLTVSPMWAAGEEPTYHIAVVEDITERKQVEEALRKLERAVEQSPTSIVITDTAGAIEYVNPKFTRLTGYTFEEVRGKNPRLLKSGTIPPEEYTRLWQTITTGGEWHGEFCNRKKNGELYWEAASISPVTDPTGAITHFIAVKEDITERKQIEAALRETQKRARFLADVLDHSAQPFCIAYPDGRIELANAALGDLLGYSEAELCALDWPALIAPDWDTADALEELDRTRQARRYHVDCVRKDGARVPVELLIHWIHDAIRDKPYYYAFITDITGRREAERRLAQEAARTAALTRTAARLNAQLDLDAVLQAVCEETVQALDVPVAVVMLYDTQRDTLYFAADRGLPSGYAELARPLSLVGYAEILSPSVPVIVVPDLQALSDLPDADLYARYDLRTCINALMRRAGALIGTVSILTCGAVRDFAADELALLQGLADQATQAITNAQLYRELEGRAEDLEQRVHERTAQLHAQYAQSEAVLRSTSDGIIITDTGGNVIQANPVAQQWLRSLAPLDAAQLKKTLVDLVARAGTRPSMTLELPNLDLELHVAPLLGTENEQTILVAMHDVSHLKALDRLKSQFVSDVSHELRTPITTIKLYASLLRKGPPEKRDQFLAALEREANRQARLVQDILQISRIENGRLELHRAIMALNDLVEAAVNGTQLIATERGVALSHRLLELGPTVLADHDPLMEVINNLIENAVWYTPRGGQVIVATGAAADDGHDWAVLTVTDTGMGIPADELPHLFDRFFRGEKPRSMQIPGTGLGLAIVKDIVELHGGRVTVESQVGSGSTFTVWLPLA